MRIKRGEIYYADFNKGMGSEQTGIRPVLVLQNDKGNKHSTTVIVATITTKQRPWMPTQIYIKPKGKLYRGSFVQLEQIKTIDKLRLTDCLGKLENDEMKKIDEALRLSFSL